MPNTFHITTMGCQMNEYDSDHLARSLIKSGYTSVGDPEGADLILINTCAVRAKPEQKALSLLGRMSRIKKKKPDVILGITGCFAQQEGNDLIKRFPQLDLVMGPREIGNFLNIVKEIGEARQKISATCLDVHPPPSVHVNNYFTHKISSHVSIMQGCDNFCSYCIVPYVRGRETCRSPDQILDEVKNLVSQGVKEITLLGQNVNSYKWDNKRNWDFSDLLSEINRVEKLMRLRFTTSHPKDLSDKLIRCFTKLDRLCPHIHLPFQSGSNRILQYMKRGYTYEIYMKLVQKLREADPRIAITSDVMVGFPGETQDDFQMTLDLIEKVQFDSLFSFKYSDRKGTLAEKMDEKIEESEKARRLAILQSLQKDITLKRNKQLENTEVEVLVEGNSKSGGQLSGRATSNKVVNFNGDISLIGQLVKVEINNGFVNSLRGKIV